MSSRRSNREYVTRLVVEKQRAIYWVCALLERDGTGTRRDARRALAELGYDGPRIEALLLLGEPGARGAGEDAHEAVSGAGRPSSSPRVAPRPSPAGAPPRRHSRRKQQYAARTPNADAAADRPART
jgi:hypothetical protein